VQQRLLNIQIIYYGERKKSKKSIYLFIFFKYESIWPIKSIFFPALPITIQNLDNSYGLTGILKLVLFTFKQNSITSKVPLLRSEQERLIHLTNCSKTLICSLIFHDYYRCTLPRQYCAVMCAKMQLFIYFVKSQNLSLTNTSLTLLFCFSSNISFIQKYKCRLIFWLITHNISMITNFSFFHSAGRALQSSFFLQTHSSRLSLSHTQPFLNKVLFLPDTHFAVHDDRMFEPTKQVL